MDIRAGVAAGTVVMDGLADTALQPAGRPAVSAVGLRRAEGFAEHLRFMVAAGSTVAADSTVGEASTVAAAGKFPFTD